MISRLEAKLKISEILKGEPIKTGVKLPINLGKTFDVYQIPLEYLVPNLRNDRIAWKIREFEMVNNRSLSYDNIEDITYVYQLIEGEHPSENEKTLRDLALKGQQNHGVITNDGKIIDGNRRATLLKKLFEGKGKDYQQNLEKFRYFEAIILAEDISDKEIMALETSLQIGEDVKVGYNPINIYIKIDNLLNAGYNINQISGYMGIKESDIKQKIEIFKLMNEYLAMINKPNHFTLLSELEDQFIKTLPIFKKLDNKTYPVEWDFNDNDVANFKEVIFDYIHAKYEGKDFRNLLGTVTNADGVFLKEKEWKDFYERHLSIIDNATLKEESDWVLLKNKFSGNLNHTKKQLDEYIDENNITSIINAITTKLNNLKTLIDNKEILDVKDLNNLKKIEKTIYNIRKDFD